MANKFKKEDFVAVIAGKDKGKKGGVLKVFPKLGKLIISDINLAVKHCKPTKSDPEGGVLKKEMPMNCSNIMHVDPKTDLPTKIGYKFLDDGKKVRYSKNLMN